MTLPQPDQLPVSVPLILRQPGRRQPGGRAARMWSLAAAGCFVSCLACGSLSGQSSNPGDLRRIIEQKNAEAAAATWGYYVAPGNSPSYPTAPAAAPAGSSSNGFSGSPAASGASTGAAAVGSLTPSAPDPDNTSPATAGSTNAPGNAQNSAPVSPQPDAPGLTPDETAKQPAAASAPAEPDVDASSAVPAAPATAARKAVVTFVGGLLTVRAEDSSLDEILHAVCSATGMTLTGSVRDERVYGTTGPARPAQVIAQLLDGVKTNFLLRQDAGTHALELVLTPRAAH